MAIAAKGLKGGFHMAEVFRAINCTRGTVLCERVEGAGGLIGHSKGLLGRHKLEPDEGMLFEAGRFEPFMWMHMFFMRFPIDIVFLDCDGKVMKINSELRPWRLSSVVFGAQKALELSAGAAARSGTTIGDRVDFDKK